MEVDSLRKLLFFSTVRIEAGNAQKRWTGTGFFFGDSHVQIATNKHVLEGAEWIVFTALRRRPDGGPDIGHALQVRVSGPGVSTWLRHPDDSVDVAIFPAAELFDRWVQMSGQQPYYRAVTPDAFADLSVLDAIEDITFVGYPNGLFDQVNWTPLARHGMTATPPSLDHSGKPVYLIDAPVFGGSSGSPVFVIRDALANSRDGSMVLGEPRVLFVGVVAAVKVRPTKLEVTDGRQSAIIGSTVFRQELGLGIVYKPHTLLEVMSEAQRLGRR